MHARVRACVRVCVGRRSRCARVGVSDLEHSTAQFLDQKGQAYADTTVQQHCSKKQPVVS